MSLPLLNLVSINSLLSIVSPEEQRLQLLIQIGIIAAIVMTILFAVTRKAKSELRQLDSLTNENIFRLIVLNQQRQLFWIRIIGIPFLIAAIGTFLAVLISASNGRGGF